MNRRPFLAACIALVLTGCDELPTEPSPVEVSPSLAVAGAPDRIRNHIVMSISGEGLVSPGIWVVDPDGSDFQHLADGRNPTVSPDGRKIAYVGFGALHVMNADGSNRIPVLSGGGEDLIAWSPDGRRILASDDYYSYAVTDPAGLDVRWFFCSGRVLGWAADGASFYTYDRPSKTIREVPVEGPETSCRDGAVKIVLDGGLAPPLDDGTIEVTDLSADGSKVLFDRTRTWSTWNDPGFGGDGEFTQHTKRQVWIADIEAGWARRLAGPDAYGGQLSPDGTQILFHRLISGGLDPFLLMDVKGCNERPLPWPAGLPAPWRARWSRSGGRVIGSPDHGKWYTEEGEEHLYSVAVNGSGAWHLTEGWPGAGWTHLRSWSQRASDVPASTEAIPGCEFSLGG